MLGVMATADAIAKAKEVKLDLIEVSPNAEPPVAKILDFGKYKFQEQKKVSAARKKQKVIEIKEIKVRPGIEEHDYQVKLRALQRFIEEGNKVKVTLRFRGREIAHQEIALLVMDRLKHDMGETVKVELQPRMEGRQMLMIMGPLT